MDDLHERAGSTQDYHLHGQLRQARSTVDPSLIYPWDKDILVGDKCEKGSQLRPHIVWFGQAVPLIEDAQGLSQTADYFIVIGTSLKVYPAAGLIYYAPRRCPKFLIDPNGDSESELRNLTVIRETATAGVARVVDDLMSR